jgi:hypothetical protein
MSRQSRKHVLHEDVKNIRKYERNIVAYLLKARTAEPEKQPLLCNDHEMGGYTRAI